MLLAQEIRQKRNGAKTLYKPERNTNVQPALLQPLATYLDSAPRLCGSIVFLSQNPVP